MSRCTVRCGRARRQAPRRASASSATSRITGSGKSSQPRRSRPWSRPCPATLRPQRSQRAESIRASGSQLRRHCSHRSRLRTRGHSSMRRLRRLSTQRRRMVCHQRRMWRNGVWGDRRCVPVACQGRRQALQHTTATCRQIRWRSIALHSRSGGHRHQQAHTARQRFRNQCMSSRCRQRSKASVCRCANQLCVLAENLSCMRRAV